MTARLDNWIAGRFRDGLPWIVDADPAELEQLGLNGRVIVEHADDLMPGNVTIFDGRIVVRIAFNQDLAGNESRDVRVRRARDGR